MLNQEKGNLNTVERSGVLTLALPHTPSQHSSVLKMAAYIPIVILGSEGRRTDFVPKELCLSVWT